MKSLVLSFLLAAALPAADSGIVPSMNAFTTDTYKHLAGGDGNLIVSPFNIAAALSMALAGAQGRTADEIQSVLHVQSGPSYDASLGTLLADLSKAGNAGRNELLMANGLWVQKGFELRAAFEKTLADNYRAPLAPVDFIGNYAAARSQINGWTEEHTKGKIKNLFPAGTLDIQTRLVLTSAIYFYGKWQDPFVPTRTQPAPFTLSNGTATEAKFMNQTSHFEYAETPSAQILEMRYAGTGMAFDVLLPKTVGELPEVEKSLTPENLAGWLGQLSTRNVQVSLPKFRAEASFSLGKTLSMMGMPTAFTGHADFSGMSSKDRLSISEVVHKSFVDVSEEGTEAAAATGIAVLAAAVRAPDKVVVFRADHPFIFLIRDTRTGVILFIGRLMDPR
jgi:serpin B